MPITRLLTTLTLVIAAATSGFVSPPTARASASSFCGELGGDWDGQYCHTSVVSEHKAVRDIKVAVPADLIDDATAGPVVRDYLRTLVTNWKSVGAQMVADSFGEENYQVFRHGSMLSAVFHEDYHADGPKPNNAYRTFTFDTGGREASAAGGPDDLESAYRNSPAGPALHPGSTRCGRATARPGNLPIRRRPLDTRQGLFRRLPGLGTNPRRIGSLPARLPGGSRRADRLHARGRAMVHGRRSRRSAHPALGTGSRTARLSYALALPARHCSQGMFQSPSPSVPGSVPPTVLTTSTTSPVLMWS